MDGARRGDDLRRRNQDGLDRGRWRPPATAPVVERLLAEGYRVLAIDPFYVGESKIAGESYLWMLLLVPVSESGRWASRPARSRLSRSGRWPRPRPSRWRPSQSARGPVRPPRCGGMEDKAVGRIDLRPALGSLKEVIERNWTVEQAPELFCFGQLEQFDIPALKALLTPP